MTLYSIVWKYKIKLEYKQKFESEYGFDGTWNSLFRKSKNHKGSYLHQSEDKQDTYLLIDTWTDKVSYENFTKINEKIYEELSSKFEFLYITEEKIGAFNAL